MKQTFFKFRSASIILALSGLMISLSVPSFANIKQTAAAATATANPSVTYVSSDDAGASFLVKMNAATPFKFELTIKDKAGIPLFKQIFEAATFSKVFKVLNDETGDIQLTFIIKNLPAGSTETFLVSTEEKFINEVVVTKAK